MLSFYKHSVRRNFAKPKRIIAKQAKCDRKWGKKQKIDERQKDPRIKPAQKLRQPKPNEKNRLSKRLDEHKPNAQNGCNEHQGFGVEQIGQHQKPGNDHQFGFCFIQFVEWFLPLVSLLFVLFGLIGCAVGLDKLGWIARVIYLTEERKSGTNNKCNDLCNKHWQYQNVRIKEGHNGPLCMGLI